MPSRPTSRLRRPRARVPFPIALSMPPSLESDPGSLAYPTLSSQTPGPVIPAPAEPGDNALAWTTAEIFPPVSRFPRGIGIGVILSGSAFIPVPSPPRLYPLGWQPRPSACRLLPSGWRRPRTLRGGVSFLSSRENRVKGDRLEDGLLQDSAARGLQAERRPFPHVPRRSPNARSVPNPAAYPGRIITPRRGYKNIAGRGVIKSR